MHQAQIEHNSDSLPCWPLFLGGSGEAIGLLCWLIVVAVCGSPGLSAKKSLPSLIPIDLQCPFFLRVACSSYSAT